MASYVFTFTNSSIGTQDWNVQTIFDDTLDSGASATVSVEVNETLNIGVAVDTDAIPPRCAAGTLKYNNATATWTFASDTPREFGFRYDAHARTVRLACFLEVEQ